MEKALDVVDLIGTVAHYEIEQKQAPDVYPNDPKQDILIMGTTPEGLVRETREAVIGLA